MKNYKFNIILRLSLILLSIAALTFFYITSHALITLIVIGIVIVFQIFFLFRYVDNINKMLANFFEALEFSDFSQSFAAENLGSSFSELGKSLSRIKKSLKEVRSEKEKQYQFYQSLINNTNVGILVYDKKGNIHFFNKAFRKIFQPKSIKNIENFDNDFSNKLLKLSAGDKEKFILKKENESIQLSLQAAEIKEDNRTYILLSVQNIQTELNEKEVEAWQKLIKVLTHEIMNSITPISSLASTIDKMLISENIPSEDFADIKSGLGTIKKRSEGLFNFVDKYRSLTKIPKPNKKLFSADSLLDRVENLMSDELSKNGISFNIKIVPTTLKLNADAELIEQILINLILNAVSSLENVTEKEIKITAYKNVKGKVEISVQDNGTGISDEIKEQIFIPFYTTKKSGTGIGLSLSKQIMNLHGGEIKLVSTKNEGSTFYLIFSS